MSAPKRIGAPEGGDVRSTGAPPPPLKIEREKRYVCGRCGKAFFIAQNFDKKARGKFCAICPRRYTVGDGGARYLPRHPWAWQP